MGVFQEFQLSVMSILQIGIAVATLVALVDALTRPADVFEAADKLTKNGWLLILGIALGMVLLLSGLGLLVAAVAAVVYFVDVRPAVSAYSRRR